jgi:hypothetical protein
MIMEKLLPNERFFKVAGHLFKVSQRICDDFFAKFMENYAPFEANDAVDAAMDCLFALDVEYCSEFPQYTEELRQDEEGQEIICGTMQGKSVFDFRLKRSAVGVLVCSEDYANASLSVPQNIEAGLLKFAVNNALMVLYAIASAPYHTALFHAAVVNCGGKGYMFLGKSGTGKSTHARLWLKYIAGSELLNDDNPVVRFVESAQGTSHVVVFGSPWSGKTPCYKNQEFPLGGMVLLSQAPYNKIVPLKGVNAYAALVPSVSGKRWEKRIADGLHQTENALAASVPVWHLECLPDENAARVCFEAVQ